ncbi:MAG TPA: hypothetical protein VJA46_02080 [Acidimicrobiia bacterium]|nr:hypothetical protein [Acidimicrobiia bacterium]
MSGSRAFYARSGSTRGDLITLLHPPYTAWHLSYVAIGAGLAPHLDWRILAGTLLAFFFGLGVGAHALDEVHDRPLRTGLGDGTLWALGVGGVLAGGLLGVLGAFVISPVLLVWVVIGLGLVAGYALEWSPILHSDWGFSVAWGAFPLLVGFWAQTEALSLSAILVAAVTTVLSRVQRELSTPARRIRRTDDLIQVSGWTRDELLSTWERALRLMSLAMPLLALALLTAHI